MNIQTFQFDSKLLLNSIKNFLPVESNKKMWWFFSLVGLGCISYGFLYAFFILVFDCNVELGLLQKFGRSPRKLKGKVVFITGASSGIGENIALALAKRGVKLVLSARRKDELERVKQLCIALSGGQLQDNDVLVLPMDVTDFKSHQKIFDIALDYFGTLDILVNNAGRSQRAAWENIELAVDKQLFDLNVFGVINFSRIAVKYFNKKRKGHIAVVSSLAGIVGAPFSASYTGSKHAIHGYFNTLRFEKADANIDVTLLCPGPTFSNFLSEAFTEKEGQKYGQSVQETDHRMTGERCGELCAIALANKTTESWMGRFPMMPLIYTFIYFPGLSYRICKLLGPQRLFKLRDSKEIKLEEDKMD